MKANLASSQNEGLAAEAGLKTARARSNSSHADLARAKLDYERAEGLFKSQLISRQDYDAKKATYEVAQAVAAQEEAGVAQSRAQVDSAHGPVSQARAQLIHAPDGLTTTPYPPPSHAPVTTPPTHQRH